MAEESFNKLGSSFLGQLEKHDGKLHSVSSEQWISTFPISANLLNDCQAIRGRVRLEAAETLGSVALLL